MLGIFYTIELCQDVGSLFKSIIGDSELRLFQLHKYSLNLIGWQPRNFGEKKKVSLGKNGKII
jgi:hypothetical protein